MINKKRLIKRFVDYVKIESPSKKESKFSSYLCNELKTLGIKLYFDGIGNMYIDIKGNSKAEPVLLNAHIDTVVHDKAIVPKIKGGCITSKFDTILGADNKAGVAVIVEVLNILKEKKLSHPDLQVIFTVQEEIGLKGAKALKRDWIYPAIGYVLDGGDVDTIYHEAPAQTNIEVEVIGCAAHAGVHPEEGISAIIVASEAIAKMKLGRIDFETTANIGVIEGGKATNIIPEKVFIKGEARSHDECKLEKQLEHMQKCLADSCKKHKARLKLKEEEMYDCFCVPEKSKAVAVAKKSLHEIGLKPKLKATGGGSDANIFNEIGIQSVIIGVGADNVHTSFERICIKDLANGARFLLGIIKNSA